MDLTCLAGLAPEVVKDLIAMLAGCIDIPKRGAVKYGNTEFNYCLLDDILKAVRKSDRFAVLTPTENGEGQIVTQAILIHASGAIIQSPPYTLKCASSKPQDLGSATTYARRYVLASFLGIAADPDVDGDDPQAEKLPPRREKPRAAAAAADAPIPKKKEAAGRDFLAEAQAYEINGQPLGGLSLRDLKILRRSVGEDAAKRIDYLLKADPEIQRQIERLAAARAHLQREGYPLTRGRIVDLAEGGGPEAVCARLVMELDADLK